MNTRIAKTLLVAAALVGATAPAAKAYDLYDSGWNYSEPNFSYGPRFVDDDWYGREFRGITNNRPAPFGSLFSNANETDLVNAAVYRGISASFTWSGNEYNDWPDYSPARVYGELESGAVNGLGEFVDSLGDFDQQNGYYTNGTYFFDSRDTTTNLAIGNNAYGIYMDTDGNYFGSFISGAATVHERTVQVARTGSGFNGANAFSAFEGDNSQTLSTAFYNVSFVGRNVLPTAYAFSDGEGSYGPELTGSYVRVGDIALGFGSAEGLFAKDGGWLDIRGDLTLGASGTIYIRDGEITSNVYTQYYTPGTLDTLGTLAIESGILSVRSHFAQDMEVGPGQTLGFRDGAENSSRLILSGYGYGWDGEGFGDVSFGGGALRSITGENVQNGNISIVADGEGGLDGAVIGIDLGAKLTLNGSINGLNSLGSQGGANVYFNSVGNTVANGSILGGINDVVKYGAGELLLASANVFQGRVEVHEGYIRVTNSGALSGATEHTYVDSGAALVLDRADGLSLVDDIRVVGRGVLVGVSEYTGAVRSLVGTNATTGDLILGGDSTVRVDAGSTFTVEELAFDGEGSVNLTLDTRATFDGEGDLLLNGHFRANASTNGLTTITKIGYGTAAIAVADGALSLVDVQAGTLSLLGSSSSAGTPHEEIVKTGAGTLELLGTHHYGDVNFDDGTTFLRGNLTLQGSYNNSGYNLGNDDNLAALTSGTLNVESGATLTHISSDGEGGNPYTNGLDIINASVLNVKTGGVVQLNAAEIDLDDTGKVTVAGSLSTTDGIYANDDSTIEVLSGGVLNAYVKAVTTADVILRTGGTINGNVLTEDAATFTIESGSTHNGDYTAKGTSTIVVNGTLGEGSQFSQNFLLQGSATLKGSGTITGDLLQTGGTVAPGNSPGILSVGGDYSISAGNLLIEIDGTAGAGVDPLGHDQLDVTGTVTVSGTAELTFSRTAPSTFESVRGNSFQVLRSSSANATIGVFNTVDMTSLTDRVLFDHSTGIAYGTGLDLATRETFADYGDNGNRREIGRALWMESIARDNSNFADRNFESQGIEDSDLALPITDPDTESLGLKAFIFTQPADEIDETQVGTDLGSAAVSVLTAGDVGEALDALSPEAYVGFTELNTRLNRNFSLLGATGRRSGDEKKWGFNLGYSGEQVTSNGSSDYTQFKAGTNTAYLTADLALSAQTHLNLSLGMDDGDVRARGFDGDTDSALAGIGISFTTSEAFARFDLGAAFSSTDITAVRQGGVANLDEQDGYAVSLRVSFLPKDPPLKPAVAGQPVETPRLSLTPYVGLSVGSSSVDSFVESEAADTVQLGVSGYDRDSLIGEVGMGIEYVLGANTTLTGVVAYEHEFESSGETDLTAEFAEDGVTDTRFGVRSEGIGAGIFRVGLGLRQKLGAATSVGLSYDALLGSGIDSGHHLKADVSFRF